VSHGLETGRWHIDVFGAGPMAAWSAVVRAD